MEALPPLRITRIALEKSSARLILRWQHKKTERKIKTPNLMDSKNNMAMNRRMKG